MQDTCAWSKKSMSRTMIDLIKENSITLAKPRSRRYPSQTITVTDYANDIALLANTPAQAKSLLHSLEESAGGISLRVKANETEYMCFNQNQKGDISTLKDVSRRLEDKFTYLGSSISSTEIDINT